MKTELTEREKIELKQWAFDRAKFIIDRNDSNVNVGLELNKEEVTVASVMKGADEIINWLTA